MSLPVSSTMKEEVAGEPMPMRVKYSPLPWERPETTGLVNADPGRGLAVELRLGLLEEEEAREETREISRERRRRKVSSGDNPEAKRESRWAMRRWREEAVSRVRVWVRVWVREECGTGAGFWSVKRWRVW